MIPHIVYGKRQTSTNSAIEYRRLMKKEAKLIRSIKESAKRVGEAKYAAGFLTKFQSCVYSKDLGFVRHNIKSVIDNLHDRQTRGLMRTFMYSVDGTSAVQANERQSLIKLYEHINAAVGAPEKNFAMLKNVRKKLMLYIPPATVRKMQSQSRKLARTFDRKKDAVLKVKELEVQKEEESIRCSNSPVRDKSRLREINGQLVLNQKKIKMYEAGKVFSETLSQVVSDGKLETKEKHDLIIAQSNYARLQSIVGLVN